MRRFWSKTTWFDLLVWLAVLAVGFSAFVTLAYMTGAAQ
jgi:hypothetical protein